jgi:S-disulfanyl-L-cysteine oxidoreductase SoxD
MIGAKVGGLQRLKWVAVFGALAVLGCGDAGQGAPVRGVASTGESRDVLPGTAPDRFGFGTPASEARVALWDITVMPDGEGLPPGSGTVAEGERVYMVHCLACHGPTGTEGPYDRLVATDPWEQWPVNRAVGNYWPYATTLYDYIRRAMPQLTPGVLTADETYAVIAYLLHLNEIVGEDAVMNATTLPQVRMPARDRFVVDNRDGGPRIQ